MTINERLRSLMDHYRLNVNSLSVRLGFNNDTTIRNIVSEKGRQNKPSTSTLNKFFEAFPEVSKEWIISGDGEMLKPKTNITPVTEGNYMMVEYADLRTSAGRLGVGDVSSLPETHTRLVPKEFDNGNFLIVRVDGDSMDDGSKRSLSDGDEILIKERQEYKIDELPIKKALFVITTRDGNVLKQIAKVDMDKGCILCRSFNNNYEDYEIPFEDIFQIFIVCKVTNRQISF